VGEEKEGRRGEEGWAERTEEGEERMGDESRRQEGRGGEGRGEERRGEERGRLKERNIQRGQELCSKRSRGVPVFPSW
jgi:hypothetical protein